MGEGGRGEVGGTVEEQEAGAESVQGVGEVGAGGREEARCLAASSSWAQVVREGEQEDRLCREEEGRRPHTWYIHCSLDTVQCAHLLC